MTAFRQSALQLQGLFVPHDLQSDFFTGLVGAQDARGVRAVLRHPAIDADDHIPVLQLQKIAIMRHADHQHALAGPEVLAQRRRKIRQLHAFKYCGDTAAVIAL